jgi:CRISPR-associated protein Cas1
MPLELTRADLDRAWERVQENAGCAGADGVTVNSFGSQIEAHLNNLLEALLSGAYRPFPLLEIEVEKKNHPGESRRLLVPTVRDRVAQTAVGRYLSRSFEEEFLECSYAYRPARGVDRAIARIRQCHEAGYRYVVDSDIHAFFDEVDHDQLLDRVDEAGIEPEPARLIEEWTRAYMWNGSRAVALLKGVPQGSPISPLLANFFLEDFDRTLEETGRKLIRYADDFLILARTPEEAAASLRDSEEALSALHLELNTAKTQVSTFEEGFHFLGAFFKGSGTWIPWKRDRPKGRVLYMARPMPASMRAAWAEDAAARPVRALPPRRTLNTKDRGDARIHKGMRREPVAFLYLTEQGSVLRKSGDRLLVEKEDEILLDLPYHKLEYVFIFGNVQVTTQALSEVLERGIHLSFFSRQGAYRGAIESPRGRNVPLRVAQFEQFHDSARALELARGFVMAKIANGIDLLDSYRKSGTPPVEWSTELDRLRGMPNQAEAATDLASLEGTEGAAARQYFELLMHGNRSTFAWPGRVKHPATDPLNALLSLTYTLLTNELAALLEAAGMDAGLGYLHQVDYGRDSLALDLVEAFRHPVADHFVMNLINLSRIKPEDFEAGSSGGCFLKHEGMRRYFAVFEEWMLEERTGKRAFRDSLHQEVQRFVAAIRSRTKFKPFRTQKEEECVTSSATT